MSDTEPEPQEELWRYAGLHWNGKTLRHRWDDRQTTNYLIYEGKGRYVVGAWYKVQVTRQQEDGRQVTVMHGTPKFDRADRDDEAAAREVQDREAQALQARAQQERKAFGKRALDEALDPLGGLAAQCRTRAQRDALLAACAETIYRPGR